MATTKQIEGLIMKSFAGVEYPGDGYLSGSVEGEEPVYLAREFKGKRDWRKLDAKFLDLAPRGFSTALSFFSDEAFRFYLPAYLIADLRGELKNVNVIFHLCHGFDDGSKDRKVNPRRYGDRNWFREKYYRFATFNTGQARTIIVFLKNKFNQPELDDMDKELIEQALRNYWGRRDEPHSGGASS
jgi:hypothetical protein